jgi:hypothetical protein
LQLFSMELVEQFDWGKLSKDSFEAR